MSGTINKPTIGGVTLPYPSAAVIEPYILSAEQITLGGKTRSDYMARKYTYKLSWNYISVAYYNALEAVVNTLDSTTLVYEKWPQSAAGIEVLAKLSARELKVGVGDESYYSAVTLECIEVNSRI